MAALGDRGAPRFLSFRRFVDEVVFEMGLPRKEALRLWSAAEKIIVQEPSGREVPCAKVPTGSPRINPTERTYSLMTSS